MRSSAAPAAAGAGVSAEALLKHRAGDKIEDLSM